ncbi:MAG: EFR1 family ferrodoxin [Oscillospiraceae bacterium]|nr:EFR1 family ferrodoxin [Oscillospiraceae bacterium]
MAKNRIYCFSGTGNCLDLAKNIARQMGDTDIVMMRSEPVDFDARECERVGFLFPCYAGGLPGRVEEYAGRVMITPGTYTFGVVTYAGYPGCGLHILHRLHPLDYWAGVSHQCSCIWLFPHDLTASPEKSQAGSEQAAGRIAADLLAKKRTGKAPPKALVNQIESKAWPALSKKKAALLDASTDCIGCGRCVKICPRGNIHMQGIHPQFGLDCIGCLGCLQYCPVGAISMGAVTEKRERYHNPNVTPEELTKAILSFD